VARHQVPLKRKEQVAEGTLAFRFPRPDGFTFQAGQFLSMSLIDPSENDAEGSTRSFSIASPPFESDLTVATRIRDTAFKRVLKDMPPGREVSIAGPFGTFTLGPDSRPAVFLVGGIGITPFRSMILQAVHDRTPRRLFLFYSNRRPEDAPFLDELLALEGEAAALRVIGSMTEMHRSRRRWQGEMGYIDGEMLGRYLGDLAAPIYYSAGPPGMVAAMRSVLTGVGVREDDIVTEEFSGYP
jgi:ferredoxin-NADP reductase